MKIKSIEFIFGVENIFDDITDVSVKLENGHTYVVVVATPKYLLTLIDDEKSDFLSPDDAMK
jgi:hypothetical protein